jgi:hypothetical protein
VNNRDVCQATHLEAVEALLQPTSEVVLLVRHDPQPFGLKVIQIEILLLVYFDIFRK